MAGAAAARRGFAAKLAGEFYQRLQRNKLAAAFPNGAATKYLWVGHAQFFVTRLLVALGEEGATNGDIIGQPIFHIWLGFPFGEGGLFLFATISIEIMAAGKITFLRNKKPIAFGLQPCTSMGAASSEGKKTK